VKFSQSYALLTTGISFFFHYYFLRMVTTTATLKSSEAILIEKCVRSFPEFLSI
jgi:hypothetical protein